MHSRLTFAIVLLVLLLGCERAPVRGIVIKKQYCPSWIQIIFIPNADPSYPGTIVPIHYPEQWDMVIQPDGTHGPNDCTLIVTDHATWDHLQIGDIWERPDTIKP